MSPNGRPKIVVLGMMASMPFGGVIWQTLHYLIGFERLGYEAYYVEAHGRSPSMLLRDPADDPWLRTGEFLSSVLGPFGLGDRWVVWPPGAGAADARGPAADRHPGLYRDAAAVLNLHGGTEPREEMAAGDHLVFVETDPVRLQVELQEGAEIAVRMLEPHCALFSFGENCGRPGCGLPVSETFTFLPTRQPVVVDLWSPNTCPVGGRYTTVGNWRQAWRHVQLNGETYFWTKHREFEKVLGLPTRTGAGFELCLSSVDAPAVADLEAHGWWVRPAIPMSLDADRYRRYVQSSRGEFTVAKDQNVRLRTGWFSDRSATYLAAGRPVVTQDTGFGDNLPVGAGLLAFADLDGAAAAVEEIERDHERHARAALEIAREHFAAVRVLSSLLARLGIPARADRSPLAPPAPTSPPRRGFPFVPANLDLTPTRRRPLVLAPETARFAKALSGAAPSGPGTPTKRSGTPTATVVIVSYGHPELTALCLASLLGDASAPAIEVLVIDNLSDEATRDCLRRLARLDPRISLMELSANEGFAAAANAGIQAAGGALVALLNNDVVLTPGWLGPLARRLDDEEVGAVGPMTNRSVTQAQLNTPYRTYGELLQLAARRRAEKAGAYRSVPMLEMYCFVARREVLTQVGPLDTRFGTGLFEDDDYSARLAAAGYRVELAEDAFVHHFGEGSFGDLHPDGSYARLFAHNQRRFEEKWSTSWPGHDRLPDGPYAQVCRRVVALQHLLAPNGGVAVISRGDQALVPPGARHFPGDEHGRFAGCYPRDDEEALAELARARAAGVRYLIVPSPSAWWLDYYRGFGKVLDGLDSPVSDEHCRVVSLEGLEHLRRPPAPAGATREGDGADH